ncbi:hypothetical protein BDW22DRAFT_1319673 [Trametopsis cervina]|nr:hypothetical protein BDW22DRAFT_1319673 [Trametopsis cervina]
MSHRGWYLGKSNGEQDTSQASQETENLNTERDSTNKAAPRPLIDRAITAAISTPHDALLAELHGQRPDVTTSAKLDTDFSALSVIPSLGSLERPAASPGRSNTASPAGSPEPLYDPVTGALAYIVPSAHDADSSPFEQAKDELWSQLGRIRELQSEVAIMHTNMEGIGAGNSRKPKRSATRTHSDTIVGEDWPDPAEVEQEQSKARDVEFASLSQVFEGRHAAIGKIMDKLDELSKSLTSFHALPTPAMIYTSRNNTKDTGTIYSIPSPTLTSPASPGTLSPNGGSPTVPQNINTLQAKLAELEMPRAESPESA